LGTDAVNAEETEPGALASERGSGGGFDAVIDATGHHAGVSTAVEHVRKGGHVVMVGIPNDSSNVAFTDSVRGEVTLYTSYGSTWRNFEQALRLIGDGAVDAGAIIDDTFSASRPAEAFEAFLDSETCKPVFSFA
jgi:L-iditol 2-dehydrogenase